MKRIVTLLLAAVLFVGALVILSPKALAATTVTITDSMGVNMREGAGTSYSILIAIPYKTELTVQDTKSADGYTWGKVKYSGKTGWIALEFTDYEPEPPASSNKTEWVKKDGKWYYYIDGVMQTGWQTYNGDRYYLNKNGVMQTGWLEKDGNKYYLRESGDLEGAMVIGKIAIDGKYHKFNQKGVYQGVAKYMTSDACLNILKAYEGFSAKPYWDVSQWTVGYGTRCPDEKLDYYKEKGITEKEAEILLRDFIIGFEEDVEVFINRYKLDLTPSQYDALVCFTYNCGSSWTTEYNGSFHNAIKNGATGSELLRAFGLWTSAGGEIVEGLIDRRKSEVNMYLNGTYSQTIPANYCHVYFNVNGGEKVPRVQCYDSNEQPAPAETPTYENKYFAGWYTSKTGGTKVTKLTKSLNGKTLYARWSDTPVKPDPVDPTPSDPTPSEPAPTPVKTNVITVTEDVLNVRKGPGTNYDRVTQVTEGTQVKLLELKTVGNYVWGRYYAGWIRLDYTDYNAKTFEIPDGWLKDGGKSYYVENGKCVTSWKKIGGKQYYFNSDGAMKTGWLKDSGNWYYFNGSGVMQTGWIKYGGDKYYLDAKGVMATGTVTIDGVKHKFNADGVWLGEVKQPVKNGWKYESGKWYYYKNDVKQTGWLQDGGAKYYLDSKGVMVTGTVTIDGVKHQFNSSGAWQGEVKQPVKNGWKYESGKWYYYKNNVKQKGWLKDGGAKYYLDSKGVMVTGTVTIDGVKHKFNSSGAWQGEVKQPVKNGWKYESGKWYYYKNNVKQKGWLKDGGAKYYLDSKGVMVTGTVTIDGVKHKFNSSGAWQGEVKTQQTTKNGWKYESGKWYYYKNGVKKTGWLKDGGKWYYLKSNGVMATGWLKDGGTWYYLNSSGAMVTGWIKDGGTWYYLNSSGAMVTGTVTISGKTYKFNSSGACLNP